ncbi:hypothetical protein CN378_18690 [Bacillus sp. AFS015802]|uniref:hypothetical protein n=1 Tax=Bacillus sp. AFS015802 TaxID=2033486 RepID=UPI000BF5F59F|nr:hypothetical protein [Bacillus sp. AFS015802]PFA63063.1 hypothetical protein CN378_18690 [Bacillus sp. AFS015802]
MLRKYLKPLVLILVVLMISACSNDTGHEEQNIIVSKQVGDGNNYEEFNKITDTKQVEEVRKILADTHWNEAQVDFIRPADYQFIYEYKNSETDAKPVLHSVWISPKKDELEVMQGPQDYTQLPKAESARLFEILTGESLGE